MTIRDVLLLGIILVAAGLAAGCVQSPGTETATPSPATPTVTDATPTVTAPPGTNLTTGDLIPVVARAAAFAREIGKEKALAAFNDPNGPFADGDLSIFAGSYDGTVLADPRRPDTVGTNLLNATDRFGIPIVRNLGETARFGRGYVSYVRPNPERNGTVEPGLSVVEDVDGTYYVGAGIHASEGDVFPSTVLNTSGPKVGVGDLVSYVKDAVAYARENGEEKALAAFTDPTGSFARGELVVMAFDYNGTNLASPPYAPEVAANRINLINYHDPDGVDTVRGMRDLARDGGGFFYTVAKVTVDQTDVYLPKIDYAEPVDGDWWLFSGIIDPEFGRIADGNLTGIPARNHTRTDLHALVERAVAFAKANGKEKTLAAIDDPKGPFVLDDLFVWAESTDGVLLADPYWKSGIGQNHLDYTDSNGLEITKVGIAAMQNGTGFSHALFPNTGANGTENVPKLIYMKAVDDSWWIGAGVYGVEVT